MDCPENYRHLKWTNSSLNSLEKLWPWFKEANAPKGFLYIRDNELLLFPYKSHLLLSQFSVSHVNFAQGIFWIYVSEPLQGWFYICLFVRTLINIISFYLTSQASHTSSGTSWSTSLTPFQNTTGRIYFPVCMLNIPSTKEITWIF